MATDHIIFDREENVHFELRTLMEHKGCKLAFQTFAYTNKGT